MNKVAADVVVLGAGVAGCSAYYNIAKHATKLGLNIKPILVDELPPMSLTSARGTFAYRNWFPQEEEKPLMQLVSRSIDLLEDISISTQNVFDMNRSGYLFVTRDEAKIQDFQQMGQLLEAHGGGELRIHPDKNLQHYNPSTEVKDRLDGADLVLGCENIQTIFPSLMQSKPVAALHVRRCGSLDPFKLCSYELEKTRTYCPRSQVLQGKMVDVKSNGGRVTGVEIATSTGETYHIATDTLVLAPGPKINETMDIFRRKGLTDMNIPLIHELHGRVVFNDPDHLMQPTYPLTFDADPVGKLHFTKEELQKRKSQQNFEELLQMFPSGIHVRPYGNDKMMAIWTFDNADVPPIFPAKDVLSKNYKEICMRGLLPMYPQMQAYLSNAELISGAEVDGGYYCKTKDNMPLIGSAPSTIEGVFLQAAMSGIGLMSSAASGELLAAHVLRDVSLMSKLQYASSFNPSRFEDQIYVQSLGDNLTKMGQV